MEIGGCTGVRSSNVTQPPTVPFGITGFGVSGKQDDRPQFSAVFCNVLISRDPTRRPARPCSDLIWTPGADSQAPPATALHRRWRLILVPGYLGECFADHLVIFGDARGRMREMDVDMNVLHASGRGSTEHNGLEIAEQLRAIPADDRLNVVVAYSKGAPDVLAALNDDPSIASRLYAVVSVAGALGGSPLADRPPGGLLPRLVDSLSIHKCRNREEGGLDSLRTEVRTAWSADHKLASGPKYFAIVTFPQQSRISRALRGGHASLSKISAANDGQLVHYAELAPGMTLLAYANADHWAIALPLKDSGVLPHWAEKYAFDKNDFPRDVLIEGLVRYLDAVAARTTVAAAAAANQD